MEKTMTEPFFRARVAAALAALHDALDALEDDHMDLHLGEGALHATFESASGGGGGPVLLSQQVPLRELWLSADRQAWHFRIQGGRWVEKVSGQLLERALEPAFTRRLGLPVHLPDLVVEEA